LIKKTSFGGGGGILVFCFGGGGGIFSRFGLGGGGGTSFGGAFFFLYFPFPKKFVGGLVRISAASRASSMISENLLNWKFVNHEICKRIFTVKWTTEFDKQRSSLIFISQHIQILAQEFS
jgi:hypothetical protein